jgi:PIN domain nuclease of toxin-antitoxin system
MSKAYVFDSSAIICMLGNETGAEEIERLKPISTVSSVNYAEVVSKLKERGGTDKTIDDALASLNLNVVNFDMKQAVHCGRLRGITRSAGLSLGDRACLSLAAEREAIAVTTDRAWTSVDVGVEVLVVR